MSASLLSASNRIVITGLGVVSPVGIGVRPFWEAVVAGRSGVDWIKSFDASSLYCRIAGEVRDFVPEDWMEPKEAKRAGRFSQFAVAAARLALQDAGLHPDFYDKYAQGAVFGTTLAGNGNVGDELYHVYETKGPEALEITSGTQLAAHAATSHVCINLGFHGPNTTSGVGCVGSLDSVATSARFLRLGQARAMIAGGTEACISPVGMGTLCRQRVLSSYNNPPAEACRPFDDTRNGLVLSEGAGAVVLETLADAQARDVHIYAEVLGYASATEAYHLIAADPSGEELAHAFRQALWEAKTSPDEIDYVCAHGIGNRQYDIAETNAVKMVLGERAYNIPMSSLKSTTGQPFAAGGAWQIAACQVFATSLVPPTINLHTPDPECDLDYVPNQARRARVDTIMINAHSLGGTHGAMILRRYEDN
jgi:3-oxoacyl-[acyl-carrier-protein] synthase II